MKTKSVAFSIVVFIFLSCLGKGFDFNPEDIAASPLLESQPISQFSALLCVIPVNIVNSLINCRDIHKTFPAKQPVKNKKNNRQDSSSKYSIFAPCGENMNTGVRAATGLVPAYVLPCFSGLCDQISSAHHPPGPPVELILFMMLLFVVLPRSGISDSMLFYCPKS